MKSVNQMSLEEVASEINEITPVLRKAFAEAGPTLNMAEVEVFGLGMEDGQKSERLANMNTRLQELGERKSVLEAASFAKARAEEMASWASKPKGAIPMPTENSAKLITFGDFAMKSADQWLRHGGRATIDIDTKSFVDTEVKTIMSTGAGFAPQALRSGVVTGYPYQMPTVIDLIPVVPTAQNAYVFMRQTTRTNNAAEAAESVQGTVATYGESAYAYTQITEPVQKIAHFVPITDEQMEDIPGIEAIIRQEMIAGVRQRLSSQLLNGNGTAPNLTGFLDNGHTPTDVNATGEFVADAIDKLIEAVRVNGFTEPDAIVMNPADWHGYRRATTTDGIYIAGNPSENTAPMLWGKPVVLTTEIAAGTALAGDFANYSRLAVKRGVDVSISTEHSTYFINGLQAIKAEMRAAFAVLREAAFAKTDDIVVS